MFKILSRLISLLFISGLIFSSCPAMADEGALPGEMFTAIMLKALNYDRNIDRQGKDKVIIGIVSSSDDTAAQGFSGEVKDNIDKVDASFVLKDKPVSNHVLAFEKSFDKAGFEQELKGANISVLIVAVNDTVSVNKILEATKELQINSICGTPGCAQNGIGLEIIQKDNKPHMLINLNSVKQEGSDYNSKFLAMCEIVK